jgi:hypothetical protein
MSNGHTDFNPGSFTCGALGGACLIAGPLGAGLRAAGAQRASRWDEFRRSELEAILELTEFKLERAGREIEELRIEQAKHQAARRRVLIRRGGNDA